MIVIGFENLRADHNRKATNPVSRGKPKIPSTPTGMLWYCRKNDSILSRGAARERRRLTLLQRPSEWSAGGL